MTDSRFGWNKGTVPFRQLLLFSTFFFLPVALPALFGWATGLFAVPVFLALAFSGPGSGRNLVSISLALAGLCALALQQVDVFLFSIQVVPLGFVLYHSTRIGESAVLSGAKGLTALVATWLLFLGIYGAVAEVNPYRQLLVTLDGALQQTVELSTSKDADLSPEMVAGLNQAIEAMRETIPKVLPGLLLSMAIMTVWLNMVVINSLATRITGSAPWGSYATWKLPEPLVWLPVAAIATMLFGSGTLQEIGIWMVMVAGLLYLFQGLAVLMTLLTRWRVPPLVRTILYVVCFLQSYGLLLLALLGLIDVWFNLRKNQESNI
jgi:uncharacterized protein YybS (DUF2232 family)